MQENKNKKRQEFSEMISEVISHYEENGRHELLWRKKITPYKVLVSEIMLQQTQVSRVLGKFEEWMTVYPTLQKLSEASFKDILILWQGLGYQRRAKALFEISQTTKKLPSDFDDLLKLPGIGAYTASAVCSFAYDSFAHPVLETNIRTVLIDFFHQGEECVHDGRLYDDLTYLETFNEVKSLGAREWYYALMDFGAYLKSKKISHNKKSAHNTKQSPYKGSRRELRAKILFAITKNEKLPHDERTGGVVEELLKEKYIIKKNSSYVIYEK